MNIWIGAVGIALVCAGVVIVSSMLRRRKLISEIAVSADTEALLAYAENGNDDGIAEAAKDRLRELAGKVTDADLFLRIHEVCGLDRSVFSEAAGGFSPEDLLLKAAPVFDTDDPACGAALEHIWDEKVLAEIIGLDYGMAIRRKALARIMDPDLLFRIALDNPGWPEALDRIRDRDRIYEIALSHPESREAVSRLDMEQLGRFGMDCCRRGFHDWESVETDTTNEELDIRSSRTASRCRRCGRVEVEIDNDVSGTKIIVKEPGLFGG
ncbi:MAG: hypothetical protein K6E83_06090 [Clostridium sp.]|nr:hypothetical protein [Clostridium sp.]